jgi:hypothetical protein
LNAAVALLLSSAVIILATGCGSGDDDGGSTPEPSGASPPNGSPGAAGAPATIDLASETGVTSYAGRDEGDLINVSATVAVGDFNDDGNVDALVGAPQADGPDDEREDSGEAYVMFGPLDESRDLGAGDADVTIFGAAAGDGLGFTTLAGDLNGDGVDDVIIGAPGVTAGFDPRSDQGRIYVFFGDSGFGDDAERDLAEDVFDFTVTGAEGFSRLGHALAIGDVNDDGVQDLVGGAPFAGRKPGTEPGGERTALGEVYVIFGSDDLDGEKNIARDEFDVLLSGGAPFGQFGAAVGAGDVTGDGTDDIVVGAYRATGDAESGVSGVAYVFRGDSDLEGRLSVEDDDQGATITGPALSSLGFPLAVADFSGDQIADIAIGAQLESAGLLERQGAVHVILGSESFGGEVDAGEAARTTITGAGTAELFPSALGAADIDGDGAADLITGSSLAEAADRPGAGVVRVFTRLNEGLTTFDLTTDISPITILGAGADDRLGGAVTGGAVGNNGRGLLVLAAGADGDDGDGNTGVVYVVLIN